MVRGNYQFPKGSLKYARAYLRKRYKKDMNKRKVNLITKKHVMSERAKIAWRIKKSMEASISVDNNTDEVPNSGDDMIECK